MKLLVLLCCCALLCSPPLRAQETKTLLKGFVLSVTGEPLNGASVVVKDHGEGTITSPNGAFQLTISSNKVALIVSAVGYTTKEEVVLVKEAGALVIHLSPGKNVLDEVVVVGYGTRRKADLTGSLTAISEQSLKDVPVANLSAALQGQGAGIDVQKSGGNSHPGAAPSILVRGVRSIDASNSPLIVVDGIPFNGSIDDINTNDVVGVTVLKDASSTAIYGSRGANGVVLVTTNRGRTGKPVVTYSGYGGFTKPSGEYGVMNGPEFENLKKWGLINGNPGKYTGIDDPAFMTDGTFAPEELYGIRHNRSTDWQKEVYRTGFMTDHQVGVSGGADFTQYAVSGGYHKETGVYPGQSFERFSVKLSVDQQLGRLIRFGLNSLDSYTITNGENANPMEQALRASPLASPYDSTGALINYFVPGSANQVWNPLDNFVKGAAVENRKRLNTFNTLYLDVSLAKGLKYRFNAGTEIHTDIYGNFYASNTTNNLGGLSTSTNSTGINTSYTLENLLTYDRTFGGRHKVNFTGLYSLQQYEAQSNSFSDNSITADYLQYYNPQYAANLTGTGSYQKWDIISYMGRLNYTYADRYLLTLTLRSDGSSRLAPGNKYHVFPSAAAAWNINHETFMKNTRTFSDLKLRLSYGTVGNTAIDPYQTLGSLSAINYNFGTAVVTGAYPTNVPNPNLTWEYTSTLNLGLDFGVLNNRVTGSVDLYHEYTNNLLLPESLPPTSGIPNAVLTNIGKTENQGIELQVGAMILQSKGKGAFTWRADLNLYINRGKITRLENGVTQDIANNWFVGHPIGTIFDYKKLGIWQNTGADSALAQKLGLTLTGTGSVIGTIKVADVNGNGKIDAGDRITQGSNQPKWEGGMTNRFSYRGFDFTVVAFARVGGTITSSLFQSGGFVNTYQGNYNNINVNYWTPANHENVYPKPNSASTNTPYSSLLSYFDGTFVKIRSLSLGYTLPRSWLTMTGFHTMRVYATAQNPFILFSPYRNKYGGVDPETAMGSGAGSGNEGAIGINTPSTWSMIFGVNGSL
ncbi:SusC/RagA family TonB-linked outer membrane protein [Dinghuibacter silviterrae]|uniref:TonB-linked SusC/RagA family outer membrane protein n=1 Tax=Dinghuibacter silviterrae TaxID=1539049 RepID=A0A4R8DV90_9BACT|nr:TonB-dependent receptor [Dinghuibacter silviterrae]TDX01101.1 TonB-linked SusC/RagA family outer membrane protein [Dinghuibacter silviterrae]